MSTIKISKESMEKFGYEDVVDLPQMELRDLGLECPISSNAGLSPDIMLKKLFDSGRFVEGKVGDECVALGFIDGIPARCSFLQGLNRVWVIALLPKRECNHNPWKKILPQRSADGQVFTQVLYWGDGWYGISYYYRPEYVSERDS